MSKKKMIYRWEVSTRESGQKLLVFLKGKFEQVSNKELKRKVESNCCFLNGKIERFASAIVNKGDIIIFYNEPLAKPSSLSFDPQRILFEDESLLVYHKPSGLTCDQKEIDRWKKGLLLTHRLDKETSGVLIFAKDEVAYSKMRELFAQRKIHKYYLAIVDGLPKHTQGIIENYLGKKHHYQGNAIYGQVSKDKGLIAITKWIVKQRGKRAALVLAEPITGRTHQIRAHLAEMGHPILGDFAYGKEFSQTHRVPRIMLHAYRTSFAHPITSNKLDIIAPLPFDFSSIRKTLVS
ncbi:MAG: RluA family pseudouridine synthase [Parachlamydiaceae bacterium]